MVVGSISIQGENMLNIFKKHSVDFHHLTRIPEFCEE